MVQLTELGNRALLRILAYFFRNPTATLSYTNLRKRMKIAKATLTAHLKFLLKKNLINVEVIGLNKIYRLNVNNPVVKQMKILYTLLVLTPLQELGEKYEVEIYLYGSASRGEDLEQSDIDVLIIGRLTREQIFSEINAVAKAIGRTINFAIFNQMEWSQMARKDAPFYERVEKDKIKVV